MKDRKRIKCGQKWALACIAVGMAYGAQAAPVQIPAAVTGGQLLQEIPQQPVNQPRSNLDLRMLETPEGRAPATKPFLVKKIEIRGNTLLPKVKLQKIVRKAEGRRLTLQQLYGVAHRITLAYQQAGYPLSRAYVPVQTVKNGDVVISVVEARYGALKLDNSSDITSHTLQRTLSALQPGQPVSNYKLERTLLLMSDISGAVVSSVARPGPQPGTTELVTTVTNAPRYTSVVGADDYGNAATGRLRVSAEGQVNGLLHRGDTLSGSAMTSGSGMNFVNGGYTILLNGQGTTLNIGASYLHYRLGHGFMHGGGDDLAALHAHGSVLGGDVALNQPIIRSTVGNLYGELRFDHNLLKDQIDTLILGDGSHYDNARRTNVWTASLAGDERDHYGITNYRISGSSGDVEFTNADALALDTLGRRTQGWFGKLRASISRLQRVTDQDAIYLSYSAQWSNKNLDPSQQFFLGGPNTIQGYDTGAFGGDEGAWIDLEWRHSFRVPMVPGAWQVAPFVNTGRISVNKDNYSGDTNYARIYSAGLNLNWAGPRGWFINGSIGKPFGERSELYAHARNVRFWLGVQKGFSFN